MDQPAGIKYERTPTGSGYVDNASFGSMDPKERVQRLDIENIERAFLYPTFGLLWEPEYEDLELAIAYARAYNRRSRFLFGLERSFAANCAHSV